MIEGEGRLVNRPGVSKGKTYDKFYIYIPTEVARDGLFPFKTGDKLKIKIDSRNKRLIIEKTEK
jgi:hypothetical protein